MAFWSGVIAATAAFLALIGSSTLSVPALYVAAFIALPQLGFVVFVPVLVRDVVRAIRKVKGASGRKNTMFDTRNEKQDHRTTPST
jgi:hypothetical protein